MTTALLILAALLVAGLAYRLWKLPAAKLRRAGWTVGTAAQFLSAPSGAIAKGDATPTPEAKTLEKPLEERTAVDWYDPLTERVEMTWNESGFITSPSPLPVWNGKTILTDGDVYEMQAALAIDVTVDADPIDPLPLEKP